MRRPRHRRKHGRKARVPAENFQHHEPFVRTGRSAQRIGHLNRTRDARAETDAVVGPRHVVVHRFRNGHHAHAFLMQAHTIAQRVVAADWNHILDTQPRQILQHFGRQIVLFGVVFSLQVIRYAALADTRGIRSRRMQERPAGAARAVHNVFGEPLKIIRIVVLLVTHHVHQPRPATADADHLVTFPKCTKGDRANGRIQSRHVAAPRQDSDNTLFYVDIRHVALLASVWINKTDDYGRCNEF